MEDSGYYESESHQNSEPLKKKCDECKKSFPMKAIFFPAEWLYNGMVCGNCFEENIQLMIEDEGIEVFLKRFEPSTNGK